MKRYRLINRKEMLCIRQYFEEKIHGWCKEFSQETWAVTIQCSTQIDNFNDCLLSDKEDILLLENQYLSFIKDSVFSCDSFSFDAACESIFSDLLQSLFSLDSMHFSKNKSQYTDWIYKGSTCIHIHCRYQQKTCNLWVNPNWVFSHFLETESHSKSLTTIEKALAEETLTLEVALSPVRLQLEQISTLKVGSVIQTDHLVQQALDMKLGKETICSVDLGKKSRNKSVLIKRS